MPINQNAEQTPAEDGPSDRQTGSALASRGGHPRRMLGRYEVIAEIARGGMGAVLLARLEGAGGFERLMAIKLMHEHLASDKHFITMLLDEARTAAHIHHPNAVGIVDIADSPMGYYLVMPYVEGFTLAEILSCEEMSERERISHGSRLLIDASLGLHAAHCAKNTRGEPLNIVHRDVSPQNILVGLDGVGRIVDFGIALAASRITSSSPGMLKGKPSYMAPEQVQTQTCDRRTDVFSLGIILWEVLVGERLFQADVDVATLLMVMEAKIPSPSERQPICTSELEAVVLKALSKDPADRYQDARAFARELDTALASAKLNATSDDVSECLSDVFAEEIANKQRAIRRHLATSTGESKPLSPGQLHLVPRLCDRGPTPRSEEIEAGGRSGVREVDEPTRRATPSGEQALSSEEIDGRELTLQSSVPAPEGPALPPSTSAVPSSTSAALAPSTSAGPSSTSAAPSSTTAVLDAEMVPSLLESSSSAEPEIQPSASKAGLWIAAIALVGALFVVGYLWTQSSENGPAETGTAISPPVQALEPSTLEAPQESRPRSR